MPNERRTDGEFSAEPAYRSRLRAAAADVVTRQRDIGMRGALQAGQRLRA